MIEEPDQSTREIQIPIFLNIGKGWNPIEYDTDSEMLRKSLEFLKLIDKQEWSKAVKCLEYRLDLDLQDEDGECALHKTIKFQHEGLTRFLLGQGADVDTCDDDGLNALHHAVYYDDLRLVQCLLFLHANIHRLTNVGFNAMHFCAARGNVEIAKLLVEGNIDFTCKANDKTRPIDYAKEYEKKDMIQFLKEQEKIQNEVLRKHLESLRQEEMHEMRRRVYSNDEPRPYYEHPMFTLDNEADYDENSHSFEHPLEMTECSQCSAVEDADLTYCGSCGFILGDHCPDCDEKDIDQKSYCKSCHRPFWVFDDETASMPQNIHYRLCPYCNAQQDDENADYCCSCFQSLLSNVGGDTRKRKILETLQCPICAVNQYEGNDYCVDCGYTMSNVCHFCGVLQFDCDSKTCYSCLNSLYDPSFSSNEEHYQVACDKCQTESNGVSNEYCNLCHYALHNLCPDCLFSPINGADFCERCGKDLWEDMLPIERDFM